MTGSLRRAFAVLVIGMAMGCTDGKIDPDDLGPAVNADRDSDGVGNDDDNCPDVANADQLDLNENGVGDICDNEPVSDLDDDLVVDEKDNCVEFYNPTQDDQDGDLVGDACDNCRLDVNLDQLDDDGDGYGNACQCDACAGDERCMEHPASGQTCVTECHEDRQCGDLCCPLGSRCEDGACPLPDIYPNRDMIIESLSLDDRHFAQGDCAIFEGCVRTAGNRRLLRFSLDTPNIGSGHLHLGYQDESPDLFDYSTCHDHYHFNSYAAYDLLDVDGNVVAPGHKQAFCLTDLTRNVPGAGPPNYNCSYQGISRGWSDIYSAGLDCQWVDVTDLPDGEYRLRVRLNHEGVLAEEDYLNNQAYVPVFLE